MFVLLGPRTILLDMAKSIALLLPVYVTLMWALVFLLQKKTKQDTNKMLGAFMVTASLLYISHAIFFHHFFHLYAFVESLYILTILSVYPFFYGYVLMLTTQKIHFRYFIRHFYPALFFTSLSLIVTLMMTPEQRSFYVRDILVNNNLKGLDLTTIVGFKGLVFLLARLIYMAHAVIYLLLGIRLANQHDKRVSDFFSNTEGRKMNWIRDISILILAVSILGITFAIIGRSYFAKHEVTLLVPSFIFSTIFFIIGFYGNQQLIISESLVEEVVDPKADFQEVANDPQRELLKKKLLALFEKERIYRLTDLRITKISDALKTNRTYVSRLINEEFGMNFNEFVNRYRVEEAEELMKSRDNNAYTLEYIAEQSGFGSANSFARAFKEQKGVTPGTFRNKFLHSEE